MKIILCIILCIITLDFFHLHLHFKLFTYSPKGSIYSLTWHNLPLNLCHWTPILSEVIFIWLYLIDTFFSFQFIAKKVKSGTAYPNLPYSSVQRSRKMNMALKNLNWKVCLCEWVVYVCVWACLHLRLCQTLPSPAAILPPHPMLARAHTHMQSIPQEPRREWQAGAGGGETSQEANRCSPSGFSQVAYIKKKRGKKPKKMKTSLRMGKLNALFSRATVFSFFFFPFLQRKQIFVYIFSLTYKIRSI